MQTDRLVALVALAVLAVSSFALHAATGAQNGTDADTAADNQASLDLNPEMPATPPTM